MVFHLHGVEVVKGELRDALDGNRELAPEVRLFGFEINALIEGGGGKDIVTDADIVDEDTLELGGVRTENLVFLESLQVVGCVAGVATLWCSLHW